MTEKSNYSPPAPLNTPVLFLLFNRPDTTKEVLRSIRQAKPPCLYVAADGPRESKPGEAEVVASVREYVLGNIDWTCDVKTLFREKNLGCKYAVSSAIDWFFDNEEMGIILEDDCLPSQSYFWYCQELLIKFKEDNRVQHIGGTNPFGLKISSNSYYFSKFNRIWGWATWRRAWKNNNVEIPMWPLIKKRGYHLQILGEQVGSYYERLWDEVYRGKIDTWDYQWMLCRMLHGHAIIPNVNLVSNIGFGENATHTKTTNSVVSNLPLQEICFPLQHSEFLIIDIGKDKLWEEYILKNESKLSSILRKFLK